MRPGPWFSICPVFLLWCFSHCVHSFCDISNICFTFDCLWTVRTSARCLRESLRAPMCQQLWIFTPRVQSCKTHTYNYRHRNTLPLHITLALQHVRTHSCIRRNVHTHACSHTHTHTHTHTHRLFAHKSAKPRETRPKTTTPTHSSGPLHRRILITSEALVSSEQNQTATLNTHTHTHTHMYAHTTNIPPPASLTVADTSKGRVRGGKSGRVWGIMGDKGSD